MKKRLKVFGIIIAFLACSAFLFYLTRLPLRSPVSSLEVTEYHRILDKYSFSRLQSRTYQPTHIIFERIIAKKPEYTAYLFSFLSDGKRVTGQLNLPHTPGKKSVIVMIRGFVDKDQYKTGVGTRPAAEYFAQHGYITIAPDFLGYGESDQESSDVFESRFEKPVTVLNLLASIPTLSQVDPKKIGIWGHSNGGQIALSVLEISRKAYPTTLWAPVTMKFPDSILQFVDELPDKGAYLKGQLDIFHERYADIDYSIDQFLGDITAPLQLHQGTKDESVPVSWSLAFVEKLKALKKPVTYFQYEGESHNFDRGQWLLVVQRDLAFFVQQLK
ncbi:MAG: alpha/beta fold hydrolase [Patescibacteria group bacterium]